MQPVTGKPSSFMPHVNGMRALAILGILVYHLNATYCPAGYFGVDVFLVISGYFLLASLMKAERPGDIHYGSFLLKKSWRILPSWLVVTLVFCFGSAWMMISLDRVESCSTALRSAFFAADFYIDHLYDYFNQKAHQNLFLHYWYLSITCQMYLIVPLLLMLLLRFASKRTAVLVFGVVGLLSLILYVLTTTLQVPESIRQALLGATGMKTAYYHLLPRLWEILAGGAVLLLPAWREKRRWRPLLETIAVLGLLLSFFWYETGSPAVYPAVIASVVFLRYGGDGPVSRLLSWRPIQFLGTISFSLYLWHWPIMAAWKYMSLGEIAWYDEAGMLALSLVLAIISWRFIERLKMPKGTTRPMLCLRFLPLLLLVLFMCGIRPYYKSVKYKANDGLIGQGLLMEILAQIDALPEDAAISKGLDSSVYTRPPKYIGAAGEASPEFMLMGDSHSVHCFPGMNNYCTEKGIRGIVFNNNAFPFWWCYLDGNWSPERAEALMEYLRQQPSVKYVFITLLWKNRLCGTAKDNNNLATLDWRGMKSLSHEEQVTLRKQGLAESCRRFRDMGVRVVLLSDVPMLPVNLSPYQLSLKVKMLRGEDAPEYLTPVDEHKRDAACYADEMYRLEKEGLVWAVIDCAEPLRQGDYYRTRNDAGQFLYTDNNHLTYAGSELVGRYIMAEWERLKRERDGEPQKAAQEAVAQ